MRDGRLLGGAEAERGQQLFASMSHSEFGPHYHSMQKYLAANPVPEAQSKHLLYLTRAHELEAHEAGALARRSARVSFF